MDRIALRGVRAFGRHGWAPGERERPGLFEIDLTIETDLQPAQKSDDLSQTVDYDALCRRIVGIVENTSYALLERLAGELLAAVFEDPRISHASLTISKPGILDGATPAVTLDRNNPRQERA